MEPQPNWTLFSHWHELLDHLCIERGYVDNLSLANRLCTENGNQSQEAFNTATKNLRNWRQGVHIPQRRNFVLLGKILEIDRLEGLRPQWNALYQTARDKPGGTSEDEAVSPEAPAKKNWLPHIIAGIVVATGLSSVGAFALFPTIEADANSGGFEGIEADYIKNVTLKVGDALIIHGARGNNCGPAPDWDVTKPLLPELITGTLSDGGLGTRHSRQCGGRVPARAVLFTATSPGTEQTALYGDPVTITVQHAQASPF